MRPSPPTRLFVPLLAASLALLPACSNASGGDDTQPGESTPGGRAVEHRTKVVVEPLIIGPVRDKIVVSAKVASRTSVDIIPKIPSVPVTQIFVEEGDSVEVGDVLMTLYDTDLQLTEQSAETSLNESKRLLLRTELTLEEEIRRVETAERSAERAAADFARLADLGDLVTNQEVDNARVASEDAQDRLELAAFARQNLEIERDLAEIAVKRSEIAWTQAKTNLEHTKVRAPISGVVASRNANVGMLTNTSAPSFVIVDTDDLVLKLRVPQDSLARLAPGQPVEARSVTGDGVTYAGVVRSVNPVLDEMTGTVSVVVDLESGAGLVSGLFCEASIITSARDKALLVSKRAVLYEDDQPVIFAVEKVPAEELEPEPGSDDADADEDEQGADVALADSGDEPAETDEAPVTIGDAMTGDAGSEIAKLLERARKIPFIAGATTVGEVEILSGLDGEPIPSDLMVIVVGQENLKDGSPITVVEEAF
jgi:multidrug efflux pump subunit AcrA (membrane-fusion protein)